MRWIKTKDQLPAIKQKAIFRYKSGDIDEKVYSGPPEWWVRNAEEWLDETTPSTLSPEIGEGGGEHIHIALDNGATARVSPNPSPELINALNAMVDLAKKMPPETPATEEVNERKTAINFYRCLFPDSVFEDEDIYILFLKSQSIL